MSWLWVMSEKDRLLTAPFRLVVLTLHLHHTGPWRHWLVSGRVTIGWMGESYDCDHWLLLRCCIWKTMLHHDQTDDQGLMNVECSPPLHVPRVCVRTWASWGHEASLRVNELSAWGVGALEADKLPPPTQGQFSENSSKMSWSGRSVCQEFLEK